MNVTMDAEFADKMPWYARVVFAISMYTLDLALRLAGMQEVEK